MLNKISDSFSKHDLKSYLSLLNEQDKSFYLKEKESIGNLFALTKELYSSYTVLKFILEEQSAKVSLFWKVSATFPNSDEIINLFEKQGEIQFIKSENNWKIEKYNWVEPEEDRKM